MTKLSRRNFISGVAAGGAFIVLSPSKGFAQSHVLRFSTFLPSMHPMVTGLFQPLAAEIAEATGGEVTMEFAAASLAPPPRQFDMVHDGLASTSFTTHSYTPGRFPLTGIAELPFLGNKATAMSQAYWEVHQDYLAKANEHSGFKLMALSTHGPGALWTNKGPITSLDDLSGLRVIVPGGLGADIAAAIGVDSVEAPAPQWYELLSRGTADGAMFSVDAPMKFKLEEFLPHYTRVPNGLFNNSFAIFMGQRDWDAMGEGNQAKVEPLLGEALSIRMGEIWDKGDSIAMSRFEEQGITMTDAEGDFLESIKSAVAPVEDNWVAVAKEKGVDGAAALAAFRERAAELEAKMAG
ncbi:TRAP transporter substrate-binding protein [Hoeflea sp. WL0058]|uniref:TRAP transporter substrate-binding protein n=1 Tax=Flavimaribacter sediminis TaxID=2865987 RepID=A0AAE2ZPF7_9HYPH|nr:TRAP transporter substrate-binding protein [Flavimaribacter sediminis]MBW8638440.1 TRAP transporter substrate-binding protein [Flavimaribacter sediminis]